MCGIAGAVNCSPDTVERMTQMLQHRGPDGSGLWTSGNHRVSLGHRRLAIIDTSSGGHQPMTSLNRRYTLTFNGEIYNYRELRQQLAGLSLRSSSDTEVLLETIARDGIAGALQKARGMFAIAVYDSVDNKISLAVDRMGEKPLYYAKRNAQFAFASELKALHGLPFLQPTIDRRSLTQLLRYNFIAAPHTIFEKVFKLEAGHLLSVELNSDGCEISVQQYWNMREMVNRAVDNRLDFSDQAAIEATEIQLQRVS